MKPLRIVGTRRWGIYRLRESVWVRIDSWNFRTRAEGVIFIKRYFESQ